MSVRAAAALFLGFAGGAGAEPLDEPVLGPKTICFKYTHFRLEKGERVTAFTGGVESMSIDVAGPHGGFTIRESEIYSGPERRGPEVSNVNGVRVHRMPLAGSATYAIWAPGKLSKRRLVLLTRVSSPALRGTRRDRRIYDRFGVGGSPARYCQFSFVYGWDLTAGPDRADAPR